MTSLFPHLQAGSNDHRPVARVSVAVERGIDRYPDGLAYALPAALADVVIGERVVVPLGRGNTETVGYVIERQDGPPSSDIPDQAKLKPVLRRDREGTGLPPDLVALARWMASYYCCPVGMALAGVLPAAVKKAVGLVSRTLVDLPLEGDVPTAPTAPPTPAAEGGGGEGGAEGPPRKVRLSPKQRSVLELLRSLPANERPIELRTLAERAHLSTPAPIRGLIAKGLLDARKVTAVEAAWSGEALDAPPPPELTARQAQIVDAIAGTLDQGFSSHLLFGVTGSGKTEVYIRLIERTVAMGRAVIVLVPEIALTPQTGGRLIRRLPQCTVAVLHSGLTAAQRHQQWVLVAAGQAQVVLGARSAAFAPVPEGRLGLIIVDEEHDSSYKQDQAPRYHGRDVALRRAQLSGCPAVLGSATPALESWHNATVRGVHHLHTLPERAPGLRLPKVEIVDFVEEVRARRATAPDRRVHLLGPRLERAIGETLQPRDGSAPGQVLLLLNRRGYANYIACADHTCGWMMQCHHCDATMVCHLDARVRRGAFVRCHHCLSEQRLPEKCPRCARAVTVFGLGTQRVEEELARKFPSLVPGKTMVRVDSDAMHGLRDLHATLHRFGTGELRLLIGTQMIAKGLDFAGVRLVGVVNADTAISLPDFRASERTFQLVSQVAGRCGRGSDPGRAIIQTFNPDLAPIALAARHDYVGFARQELAERERCGLPPVTRMVRFVVRDRDLEACVAAAETLANGLRQIARGLEGGEAVRIHGPAACPIARIAERHRQQVEAIAPTAVQVQRLLAAARDEGIVRPGEGLAVDVDPVGMM
ncbi:MAG: primosomal protein N' [Phycisphaerales bacterium]|nr:primosomal protein N' [Phycisphaerales bacterium]